MGEQLVVEIRKIIPNHLQYGKRNVEAGIEGKQDLVFSVKLKFDFGGGSCSCCCSCDRGKTKSTLKLKTKPGV